ncbi:hypothetical protein FOMPIDRAFT_74696 [Fomitopsis schrenkii]|uniref:Uncharacterized protein n=1 Tax=Fomitopsis schrenkii TaxID=2126942 RepID=S8EJD3_FOMSC|nr:hypothetical protein FOMPIDRAFT_74696 [Fomitopsis schrenkii]
MSSPSTNGTSPNGTQSAQPRSTLEADVALLQSLLVQDPNFEESDLDVAEILRRFEAADGIATGLESRLDDIMGNLDSMLGALEPKGQIVEHESVVVRQGDVVVEEEHVVAVETTERAEQGEQK